MTTLVIPTSTLRAVSLAMAKNDIRYYLNGMLIEATGSTARLVAADGHRLNIADIDLTEPVPVPVSVIVPRSLIDWTLKQAGRKVAWVEVTVTPRPPVDDEPVTPRLTVTIAGVMLSDDAVDGRFPDYARVIPTAVSGEPGQYNPRYVLDAYAACAEYLRMTGPRQEHATALRMNGTGAAVMAVGRFAAIVMPWRATETEIDPRLLRPVGMLPEPDGVPLPPGWKAEQAAVDYANACSTASEVTS